VRNFGWVLCYLSAVGYNCTPILKSYLRHGKGNSLAQEYVGEVLKGWTDFRYKDKGNMVWNIIGIAERDSALVTDPEVLRVAYCVEMLRKPQASFSIYQPYFHPSSVKGSLDWLANHVGKWYGMIETVTAAGLNEKEKRHFCKKAYPEKQQQCLDAFVVPEKDLALIDTVQDLPQFERLVGAHKRVRDPKLAAILVRRYNDSLILQKKSGDKQYIRDIIVQWFALTYTEESWIRVLFYKHRYADAVYKTEEAATHLRAFHRRFLVWGEKTFKVKPRFPYHDNEPWLQYSDTFGTF